MSNPIIVVLHLGLSFLLLVQSMSVILADHDPSYALDHPSFEMSNQTHCP